MANGSGSKLKRSRTMQGCGPTGIRRPVGSGAVMKMGHRRRGWINLCGKRSGCTSEGPSAGQLYQCLSADESAWNVCVARKGQALSGASNSGKSLRVVQTTLGRLYPSCSAILRNDMHCSLRVRTLTRSTLFFLPPLPWADFHRNRRRVSGGGDVGTVNFKGG